MCIVWVQNQKKFSDQWSYGWEYKCNEIIAIIITLTTEVHERYRIMRGTRKMKSFQFTLGRVKPLKRGLADKVTQIDFEV